MGNVSRIILSLAVAIGLMGCEHIPSVQIQMTTGKAFSCEGFERLGTIVGQIGFDQEARRMPVGTEETMIWVNDSGQLESVYWSRESQLVSVDATCSPKTGRIEITFIERRLHYYEFTPTAKGQFSKLIQALTEEFGTKNVCIMRRYSYVKDIRSAMSVGRCMEKQ